MVVILKMFISKENVVAKEVDLSSPFRTVRIGFYVCSECGAELADKDSACEKCKTEDEFMTLAFALRSCARRSE